MARRVLIDARMTMPRYVTPGRTYLITRTCIQRQFLMRPDKFVNQIYLYLLAEAAMRFNISIHAFIAMSNHQHMLIRDNEGNFPEFLQRLNRLLAVKLNRRWGRWESIWSIEQPSAVHCVEDYDRFAKLIYVLTNPVAAQAVERCHHWPGASSLDLVLTGEAIVVKRPMRFFKKASEMPEEVTLQCVRPDGFLDLTPDEWKKLVLDAIAAGEEAARTKRGAEGTRIEGRKSILRAKPTDSPGTIRAHGGGRPEIACKNEVRRKLEIDALRAFRAKYREMLEKWLAKAKDVLFPLGTYRLRLFGIACASFDEVKLSRDG